MNSIKTREQIYKIYDSALKQLAETNDALEKAKINLLGIFLTGIRYEDENGDVQISYGVDPGNPNFCDEAHAAAVIFRKAQKMIRNIALPETTAALIIWYAKIRGITRDEITAIVSDIKSEPAVAALRKLEGIKQNFADLMNSCDSERLAAFYFEAFKKFKKDSLLIMKSDHLEGLVQNWSKLVQWGGVTDGLQYSFKDEDGHITPEQQNFIDALSAKLKKSYGPDFEVRDMIACMQIVDLTLRHMYEAAANNAKYQLYLSKDESEKILAREKLAAALRAFDFLSYLSLRGEVFSTPVPYPSKEMGKASVILSQADNLKSGSALLVSEMKYLWGDISYCALCDINNPLDVRYKDEDTDPLSTSIAIEDVHSFIDQNKLDEVLTSEENIVQLARRKMTENLSMTYPELIVFFSDENPELDASTRSDINDFFSMDGNFRTANFDDYIHYAIEQYCEYLFGVSAEEYVCGTSSVASYCEAAYKNHLKLIKNGKINEPVNVEFHRQFSKRFAARFRTLTPSCRDSKDFMAVEKAFKTILVDNPRYPMGHTSEYKNNLRLIAEVAGNYINGAKADGLEERQFALEQMKFVLVKRLETFAVETLRQINKAEELLVKRL